MVVFVHIAGQRDLNVELPDESGPTTDSTRCFSLRSPWIVARRADISMSMSSRLDPAQLDLDQVGVARLLDVSGRGEDAVEQGAVRGHESR
jgi:hypothetical protein